MPIAERIVGGSGFCSLSQLYSTQWRKPVSIDLEALRTIGITKEELQDKVVERIVDLMFDGRYDEESDFAFSIESKVEEEIKRRIDLRMQEIGEQVIKPKLENLIDEFVIQKTNAFGEKKGEPVTLTEYLVAQADAYLMENVDLSGKATNKPGQYGWKPDQTRACYMLDSHLKYQIEAAMKEAVQGANKTLAKALAETAKIQLQKIAATLTVGVEV